MPYGMRSEANYSRGLTYSDPELARPDWDTYFLTGTTWVATRADCRRRKVGALIVKSNRILATGYNGAEPGGKSCLAGQCPRGLKSKQEVTPGSSYDTGASACIALHAEQNAIMYCSREDRIGATIYVTDEPCDGCMRMIKGSGVIRVVWPGGDLWLKG